MATPTSLPATFVAGNVLTAAQMNDLRGAFRIIQVVSTTKTDTFTTTSTSFTDITGMSVTITPTATSSKVLVLVNMIAGTTTSNNGFIVLDRDGTDIAVSADGNSTIVRNDQAGDSRHPTIAYLDSPATTSAVTYQIQAKMDTGTFYFNQRNASASGKTGVSTITALEVSA